MILSFKNSEKKSILEGKKKIALTEDDTNYWKKDLEIKFVTGFLTKVCDEFKTSKVKNVDNIEIKDKKIYVNKNLLNEEGLVNLISLCGFDDTCDFFDKYGANFKGKIIWWK